MAQREKAEPERLGTGELEEAVRTDAADPDRRLRLAAAYLREGKLEAAAGEIDYALALALTGSRTRLTAVVLRQRVRNLIVQRDLWRADGVEI